MSLSKKSKLNKTNSRRVKSSRDGRKVSPQAMFELRVRAVRSVLAGLEQKVVAHSLGVCEECVSRWMARFREGGEDALRLKKTRAKCAGKARCLTEEQEEKLCQLVHSTIPSQHGFHVNFWTRKVVAQYIKDQFKVTLSERTAGRIMKRHGMSPQRPKRRAYQQDPEALKSWREEIFPQIKKRAEQTGATIAWLDESSLKSGPNYGRTWAPIGSTPVVPVEGSPQKLNVIGALTTEGKFFGMSYEMQTNSDVVVSFLEHLNQTIDGKIILIMDNASYHKSACVQEFAQKWEGWIEIVYQPPYCPETNPVELVWANLKSKKLSNRMTRGKEEFFACANEIIAGLMSNQELCIRFLQHKELAYIHTQPLEVGAA